MSMPNVPNNSNITRDDAVNLILSSIAMEELEFRKSRWTANTHEIRGFVLSVFLVLGIKSFYNPYIVSNNNIWG